MAPGNRFLSALTTGLLSAATTTVVLTALAKRETGRSAVAMNSVSHIVWGDEAAEQEEVSAQYTLVGAVLNTGATVGWAMVQEILLGEWARRGSPARALASGAATSALAYVTDYHVVPPRLTPGVEKRLSKSARVAMYAVLALSLAAGVRRGPA
ncbi:hypothetical protein EON81_10350 [bacterium]|nr:MAG: hypothetical protein EON81_10350 [bacterium]